SISTTLNEWTGWDLIPAYRGVQLIRYLAFSTSPLPRLVADYRNLDFLYCVGVRCKVNRPCYLTGTL
ncbi:MAG: hypothetical protein WBE68_04850, partial [Candidatus Nitrosopolaris sp.]